MEISRTSLLSQTRILVELDACLPFKSVLRGDFRYFASEKMRSSIVSETGIAGIHRAIFCKIGKSFASRQKCKMLNFSENYETKTLRILLLPTTTIISYHRQYFQGVTCTEGIL